MERGYVPTLTTKIIGVPTPNKYTSLLTTTKKEKEDTSLLASPPFRRYIPLMGVSQSDLLASFGFEKRKEKRKNNKHTPASGASFFGHPCFVGLPKAAHPKQLHLFTFFLLFFSGRGVSPEKRPPPLRSVARPCASPFLCEVCTFAAHNAFTAAGALEMHRASYSSGAIGLTVPPISKPRDGSRGSQIIRFLVPYFFLFFFGGGHLGEGGSLFFRTGHQKSVRCFLFYDY